ncbi:hypothetical protein DVX06_12860 [Enterococcus faecium]|nr:hypothetical protein DVX06_12860 [Enterococcus faecium]
MWLKTLYRKRAVTWPFIFYTIIWTLSKCLQKMLKIGYNKTTYTAVKKWGSFNEKKSLYQGSNSKSCL